MPCALLCWVAVACVGTCTPWSNRTFDSGKIVRLFEVVLFLLKNIRPFPPGRQDAAPRKCALLHLLSAVPPSPVLLWEPTRCSLVCVRARRVRGGTGARTAAVQQELHTERQPAPAAVHRKNPTRRFPQTRVRRPLARPFCRAGLGRRSVHPQRAAPCTAHRSCKTSRDTCTAPAGAHPFRTHALLPRGN